MRDNQQGICYGPLMSQRRPAPPNFEPRVNRLIQLKKIIADSQSEYDSLLIDLLVVERAPNATIAEHMGVFPQTVTYQRSMALKRQARSRPNT